MLENFLTKNNILNDSQYGFGHNRSISIALIKLIEEITSLLDRKLFIICMFIDVNKAFDTIDNNILIKKAENMGLRGISINWLSSYLNNDELCVEIRNNKYSLGDVVCVIPQGSIVGPLLVMIYINDICNVSENLNLYYMPMTLVFTPNIMTLTFHLIVQISM